MGLSTQLVSNLLKVACNGPIVEPSTSQYCVLYSTISTFNPAVCFYRYYYFLKFWTVFRALCNLSLTLDSLCQLTVVFTCVSYAEARNRYRLDVRPSVCPSVRHTLARYQNG